MFNTSQEPFCANILACHADIILRFIIEILSNFRNNGFLILQTDADEKQLLISSRRSSILPAEMTTLVPLQDIS